jgi:hypothetical protein
MATEGKRSIGLNTADWLAQRVSRSVGLPHGRISEIALSSGFKQLDECEIPDQMLYHRRSYRRFGRLDGNLFLAANCSLVGIFIASLMPKVSSLVGLSTPGFALKELSAVLLAALPAMIAAFAGLRADMDLVRLVERSAWASAHLGKLRRLIVHAANSYDDYAALAQRVALLLAAELAEWQAVLESRRLRLSRRHAFQRHWLPISIRRYVRMD